MNPSLHITPFPTTQVIVVHVTTPQGSPTEYAAWVGLLISLLLGLFQVWKYLQDKGKLKIRIGTELEIVGRTVDGRFVKLESGKVFWSIDLANVGTKSIVFTQLTLSHTNTDRMSMVTKDYRGDIGSFTLSPGNSHSFTLLNDLANPKYVKEVLVMDATGRVYKKNMKESFLERLIHSFKLFLKHKRSNK